MKRIVLLLFCLCVTFTVALEDNKDFHLRGKTFVLDDFEDGELIMLPKWWAFGGVEAFVEQNNISELNGLGNKSIRLRGYPKNWYIGGIGTHFTADMRPYNAMKLLVRGRGKSSGTLVIELYDDDNDNWIIEPHDFVEYKTKFDDKFVYTQQVNWLGWRVLIIPFDKFTDANPTIGDDKWNPYKIGNSGGLLQLQMIFSAGEKDKVADLQIDTIKFFNYVPPKIKKKKRSSDDW
jgi:hypothetical protein